MNLRPSRGFTLMELLIVIAIIGILSAVVLVSLNTARTKGADAAIKKAMIAARLQAELYVDSNGRSYTEVCTEPGTVNGTKSMYGILASVAQKHGYTYSANGETGGGVGIVKCIDTEDAGGIEAWAAEAPLKGSSNYFCVDYKGRAITTPTSLGANDVNCG